MDTVTARNNGSDSSQGGTENHVDTRSSQNSAGTSRGVGPRSASVINIGPSTPQPQVETNDGQKAMIKWKHLTPKPSHYKLTLRCNSGGEDKTASVSGCTHVVDRLEPGSVYSLQVAAMNKDVRGGFSETISFSSSPLPPKNVRVSLNPNSPEDSLILIAEDGDPKAQSYRFTIINVDEPKQKPVTANTDVCLHHVNNLTPGATYQVYAQTSIPNTGNLPPLFSSKTIGSEGIQTVPARPEIVDGDKITNGYLKWQDVMGASSYEIKWKCIDTGEEDSGTTVHTEFMIRQLKSGKQYTASVAAINAAGKRGKYSFRVIIKTAPAPPTDVMVKNYLSSPTNTLQVSFCDQEGDGTLYKIVAQPLSEDEEACIETQKQHALVPDLAPGETYRVYIVAQKDNLESRRVYFKEALQTYPDIVTGLKITTDENCNENLRVEWVPPKIHPEKYLVVISQTGKEDVKHETSSNKWIMYGAKPSTTYSISVAGMNSAGCGQQCDPQVHTTRPSPPLRVLVANNEDFPTTSLVVHIEDPDYRKKLYEVTVSSEDDESTQTVPTDTKLIAIHGLKPGYSYRVYVVALIGTLRSEKTYYTKDAHHAAAIEDDRDMRRQKELT